MLTIQVSALLLLAGTSLYGATAKGEDWLGRETAMFIQRLRRTAAASDFPISLDDNLAAFNLMLADVLQGNPDEKIIAKLTLFMTSFDIVNTSFIDADSVFFQMGVALLSILPVNLMRYRGIVSERFRADFELLFDRAVHTGMSSSGILEVGSSIYSSQNRNTAEWYGDLSTKISHKLRTLTDTAPDALALAVTTEARSMIENGSPDQSLVRLSAFWDTWNNLNSRFSSQVQAVLFTGVSVSKTMEIDFLARHPELLSEWTKERISYVSAIISLFAERFIASEGAPTLWTLLLRNEDELAKALENANEFQLNKGLSMLKRFADVLEGDHGNNIFFDAPLISPAFWLSKFFTEPRSRYTDWTIAAIDLRFHGRSLEKAESRILSQKLHERAFFALSRDFEMLAVEISDFYQNVWIGKVSMNDLLQLPQHLFYASFKEQFANEESRGVLLQLGHAWLNVHRAIASHVTVRGLEAELTGVFETCVRGLSRVVKTIGSSTEAALVQVVLGFVSDLRTLVEMIERSPVGIQSPSFCNPVSED